MKPFLPPGQHKALEVLASWYPEPCRRSNVTSDLLGYVYSQSADRLERRGLVTIHRFEDVRLTEDGIRETRHQGLLP